MERPKKPNILFIFTDEQRQDTLGTYGNTLIKTPNLDALAERSIVFDQAYVTQPICTPARASILTGVYPHTCEMYENNRLLPSDVLTIAELLDDRDYIKAYFGKWHLGNEEIPQRGFEEKWISIEEMYKPYYSKDEYKPVVADYHAFLVERGIEPDSQLEGYPVFSRNFAAALPEELSKPAFLSDKVIEFLREIHDRYGLGKPGQARAFVLFLNFLEPHFPFFGPFDDMYDPVQVPLPDNFYDRPENQIPLRSRYLVRFFQQHSWPDRNGRLEILDNERAWRATKSRYWGSVSLVDKYVGRILDTLEELGLDENTVTVFTSDHGDMMGSHGMGAKGGVMYEEVLKVPLFFRIPWLKTDRVRINHPVSQIDFVPTLLDILGQSSHSQIQGRSWLRCLEGKEQWDRQPVVAEWKGVNGDRWQSGKILGFDQKELDRIGGKEIRTIISADGWKLNVQETLEHELYNLSEDPGETRNVFAEMRDSSIVRDLYEYLLSWQEGTGDDVVFRL